MLITGVKGVGKTTIVRKVAKICNLSHVDYADFMLDYLNNRNKDIIDNLSSKQRSEIIKKVRRVVEKKFLFDKHDERYTLVENHLSTIVESNLQTPDVDVYYRFNLAGICVLYCDPFTIFERRINDTDRNRKKESIESIIRQQKVNKQQAVKIAEEYKIPLKFLENIDITTVVSSLSKWVGSITKVSVHEVH